MCTLEYDDDLKILSMIVETNFAPGTCVMRAVDEHPLDSAEQRMARKSYLGRLLLLPISISFSEKLFEGLGLYYSTQ